MYEAIERPAMRAAWRRGIFLGRNRLGQCVEEIDVALVGYVVEFRGMYEAEPCCHGNGGGIRLLYQRTNPYSRKGYACSGQNGSARLGDES